MPQKETLRNPALSNIVITASKFPLPHYISTKLSLLDFYLNSDYFYDI